MEDREKLIAGIIVSIVLVVVGFFVIRGFWPKKPEAVKQLPPVGTTQQVYPTATPTPTLVPSTTTGTNRYYYYQSQGSSNSQSQGSQSQSQSVSGQTQSQTLPNGMTQSQTQ